MAASTARSSGTPSSTRFRTASIIVSALPGEHAVAPGGRRRRGRRSRRLPRVYSPSPEPGAGDRVRHEREAPGGDPPEQAHRVGIEMDAVDDHLQHDVRAHEGRADDAGIAMRERAHRVEDVRDGANAAVERRVPPRPPSRRCGRERPRRRAPAGGRPARGHRGARVPVSRAAPGRPRAGGRAARDPDRGGSRADGCRAAARR